MRLLAAQQGQNLLKEIIVYIFFYTTFLIDRNMETIISEIRKKGFDKLQKEIEDKLNLKRKLEQSITTLKQNITTYNNKKKYWSKENEKILQKISELKNTSEVIFKIL